MMNKRNYWFPVLLGTIAGGAAMGCQQKAEEKPAEVVEVVEVKKQALTPAQMRTVKVDAAAAERGKATFAACAACHGQEGEGRVGMAPSLVSDSFLEAASDQMLIDTITNGRAGTTMIAWGASLGAEKINDVVAYLRTMKKTEPAKLDESPLKGNAAKATDNWRLICANCHGNTGAGYQESGSGSGIGRKAFLDTVSDGYLRYLIAKGKSGTAMKGFLGTKVTVANLKAQEIEDLIAYMRKNAW